MDVSNKAKIENGWENVGTEKRETRSGRKKTKIHASFETFIKFYLIL